MELMTSANQMVPWDTEKVPSIELEQFIIRWTQLSSSVNNVLKCKGYIGSCLLK